MQNYKPTIIWLGVDTETGQVTDEQARELQDLLIDQTREWADTKQLNITIMTNFKVQP